MTNFCEDRICRQKLKNFCEDQIRRRKFSFLSTNGCLRPHCFWSKSKSLLTAALPPLTTARPPSPLPSHIRSCCRSPPPGLTAARRPPPGPCSVEGAASSTAPLAWLERTLPQQPIAPARPERRSPRQWLPHDNPVPDLHFRPHFFFAHELKH
jgi:hypothetical protein